MRNDGVEVPAAIQFKRFEASDCPDESLISINHQSRLSRQSRRPHLGNNRSAATSLRFHEIRMELTDSGCGLRQS